MAQIDQAGRPGINNVFNRAEADRAAFNETPPTDQLARFGAKFVAAFVSMGYPNGRRLTDDIADLRVAVVTMGRVTTDGVGPHGDLLDEFPYLGAPHAVRV